MNIFLLTTLLSIFIHQISPAQTYTQRLEVYFSTPCTEGNKYYEYCSCLDEENYKQLGYHGRDASNDHLFTCLDSDPKVHKNYYFSYSATSEDDQEMYNTGAYCSCKDGELKLWNLPAKDLTNYGKDSTKFYSTLDCSGHPTHETIVKESEKGKCILTLGLYKQHFCGGGDKLFVPTFAQSDTDCSGKLQAFGVYKVNQCATHDFKTSSWTTCESAGYSSKIVISTLMLINIFLYNL